MRFASDVVVHSLRHSPLTVRGNLTQKQPALDRSKLVGNPDASGMVLAGRVHGIAVEVLLDTGAEGQLGNFVSAELCHQLGLIPDPRGAPQLRTATGQVTQCMGTVLSMAGHEGNGLHLAAKSTADCGRAVTRY